MTATATVCESEDYDMASGTCSTKTVPGDYFFFEGAQDFLDCFMAVISMPGFSAQLKGTNTGGDINGEIGISGPANAVKAGVGNVVAKRNNNDTIEKYETWAAFTANNNVT